MSEERKPIKRSPALTPLSHDHHEGLLLAWKIKQGVKYEAEPERIARYCQWFWEHHLNTHFREEEQLLTLVLPRKHPLMAQMFAEHQTIKFLLQQAGQDPTYLTLQQFGSALNDHIRFEERILFPEIEKTASPDQLQQIAQGLNNEDECPIWQDRFWTRK